MTDKTPIDRFLDTIEWRAMETPSNTDELHATHCGILEIAGVRLHVYQLSDGQRVIDADDMEKFFGIVLGDGE